MTEIAVKIFGQNLYHIRTISNGVFLDRFENQTITKLAFY